MFFQIKISIIMRNFFEHTSLHGFRFIAEEERHSVERFLWTILCLISWIWSAVFFEASYTAFQENAVSYGVETMFLETNTSLPSLSVCEDEDPDFLNQRANELYGKDHDRNLEEVLGELAYFKGSAYYLKSVCKSNDIDCPKRNFSELARKVYLHSEYEVPYMNHPSSDILRPDPTQLKLYHITISGIENDPGVRQLSFYQRKCRFPDENDLKSADFYSYSSCIVDCRRRAQMELCNCTSHFTPKSKPEEHCDYDGILCLDAHYRYLSVPRENGLECNCLLGCADTEFDVAVTIEHELTPDMIAVHDQADISIELLRFPSERYRRIVVRGMLDLVVSIGGAAGLFVGASLLTILEVTYYFLFRARATK
ncbi:unnamed protein product [Nesidiocoris tenuis]|uniref:Sodium channel protein Nach n=1 Tax=Nesidiocoris tenuis TaxID=355587 RepID=A0A6H5GR59_9HEMI|nr:unnamed protein product [Nesidiocoris tenuis]